jgi:hypothetical protein
MYATNEVKVGYSLKFRIVALLHLRSVTYHAAVTTAEYFRKKGNTDVKIVKTKHNGYIVTVGGRR